MILQGKMKNFGQYWYLLLAGLIVNENLVQWALAVYVGHFSVADGCRDAFKYFTPFGYLFFTAFRMIPYLALAVVCGTIDRTTFKDFKYPVLIGGLLGILGMILWGSWTAMRPYYTGQHVSSTTAIAFVFIPIYASLTGTVGAVALAVLYAPIRIWRMWQKRHPSL